MPKNTTPNGRMASCSRCGGWKSALRRNARFGVNSGRKSQDFVRPAIAAISTGQRNTRIKFLCRRKRRLPILRRGRMPRRAKASNPGRSFFTDRLGVELADRFKTLLSSRHKAGMTIVVC
jgi:hypothetical protein